MAKPHRVWDRRQLLAAAVAAGGFPTLARAAGAGKADEAKLWEAHKATAEKAFAFWEKFLVLRRGPKDDQPLDDTCRSRFLCIIRAVSWVESQHGTAGASQPARDPMQCGNPGDLWWKMLTGQTAKQDRFVRGPGATPNYDAKELPDAVKDLSDFPAAAKLGHLKDKLKGHQDANFNPTMSSYWGIVYLIHRTNTHSDLGDARRTYKCGDCSMDRMKKGAVAYNGGGDPKYGQKIEKALALIGCGT